MPLYAEALARFTQLLAQAQQLPLTYPNAMTLATADAEGRPSARIVLLKDMDEAGFVFYTNQQSRKGQELADNPRAALLFYWEALATQVRVEGQITVVTAAEADEYWATRPRESRIGAWASKQSALLDHRQDLEQRYADFEALYPGASIPRPPHWSGYRLLPDLIEFWEERPFRLHERVCYCKSAEGWTSALLNP